MSSGETEQPEEVAGGKGPGDKEVGLAEAAEAGLSIEQLGALMRDLRIEVRDGEIEFRREAGSR